MELMKRELETLQNRHLSPGFTLIELMLVVLIGTALFGGAAYFALSYMNRVKYTTTETNLTHIKRAILDYRYSTDEYPNQLSDLWKQPQGVKNWKPFLPKELVDGWDHKFIYKRTPDEDEPYELYSMGPKGRKGSKAERIK